LASATAAAYREDMVRGRNAVLARVISAACAAALIVAGFLAVPAQASALEPRVINGTPTDGTDSFLVALLDAALFRDEGAFNAQFCGGTLTTPTIVVTAAHCVREDNGTISLPQSILVGVGGDLESPAVRTYPVTSVTVHPGYVADSAIYDVAVLTLATPVTGANTLAPLRPEEAAAVMVPGAPLRVIGWGNTSNTDDVFPSQPVRGAVTLFPDTACGGGGDYTLNGVHFRGFGSADANPQIEVCASGVRADRAIVDSCSGDSGGPLISGVGAAARLVGIVSWGQKCSGRTPGVYTRVSAMYPFLAQLGAVAVTPPAASATPAPVTAPPPPSIVIQAKRNALVVTFTVPTSTAATAFAASAVNSATGTVAHCFTKPRSDGRAPFCTMSGLRPGVRYSVTAIVANAAGNSSPAGPVIATPTRR
jgi:secreted trypsin-like serine protease